MRKRGAKESGQATVELAVMLLAVTAMLLGIIILSGVMTADNRQLLQAKLAAEINAADHAAPSWRSEQELGLWSYGGYSVDGRRYATIPFSARDQLGRVDAAAIQAAPGQFSNAAYSRQGGYSYRWKRPDSFHSSFDEDFTADPGNALEAADLIAGSGSVIDPVSGFDRGRRDNASGAIRAAFRVWFGSRITEDFLSSKLSNRVYMPRTVKKDTTP